MPRLTESAQRHRTLRVLANRQSGVFGRAQAHEAGWSDEEVAAQVAAQRWRRVHPGVYYLSNGRLTREAVRWAALLWAGPGAVLGHESAAEILGLAPEGSPEDPVTVLIPWERQARTCRGIIVRRRRHLAHHARVGSPPTTRVEHTVLDLASEASSVRDAVGWITRAYQRKLTTPARLELALNSRVRLRRRRLLLALLAQVSPDAESPLEHEYDRKVARAHGLPAAAGQRRERTGGRGVRRDRDYSEYGTVVELDGVAGHDDAWDTFRDMDRDNSTQEDGKATLRYGAVDVFGRPCDVARQVVVLLRRGGWEGQLRRCGPNCTALG
jgi:hypothetical protein